MKYNVGTDVKNVRAKESKLIKVLILAGAIGGAIYASNSDYQDKILEKQNIKQVEPVNWSETSYNISKEYCTRQKE